MKSSIFKGMMKSLISNPALLKKLHKSVEEKLAQKKQHTDDGHTTNAV